MKLTQSKLIILTSIFLLVFDNYSFFINVFKIYPPVGLNLVYIFSLSILVISLNIFLLSLVSSKYTTKPILIIVLLVSSLTNYFMNSYNVIIDEEMIRNIIQTDLKESLDLFSFKLLLYFIFLGVIPSYLVYKTKIKYNNFLTELKSKIITIFLSLLISIIIILSFSKFYTSFFREHKPLRYYTNPIYWIYSIGYYINETLNKAPVTIKKIGLDAKVIRQTKKHKLIIMVVGEAARADHFSLNGYEKETNPNLKKQNIINFSNFYSCGTSTAYSVPCMFSPLKKDEYSYDKFIRIENVIDVLNRAKISILWVDNNSDPKGVMDRFSYIDYKNFKCNGECRDIGMLQFLPKFITQNKNKDIFIVLHQMGNHGPAYYKRYPKNFEKFKPVCKTNQLEKCSKESIKNAYDNALLYTDYFLNQVIEFLKKYQKEFEVGLFYVADHGESLGEHGIYLHGLPYFMAPQAQKHVGAIMWFGKGFSGINLEKLKNNKNNFYSHDFIFSTLLGLFDVNSKVYEKKFDLTK